MSGLIRFFTKILDICRLVPMLPVVVIAAIPLALLGDPASPAGRLVPMGQRNCDAGAG